MSPEQSQALQYLASLPLQAILLVACIQLWKAYRDTQNARIDDLKKVIADTSSRLLMIEDKLGIKAPLTNTTFDKPDVP